MPYWSEDEHDKPNSRWVFVFWLVLGFFFGKGLYNAIGDYNERSRAEAAGVMETYDFLLRVEQMNPEELECMTLTLYFEGRGESDAGQIAIGEVVMNRLNSDDFPDTICGVVKEANKVGLYQCQFTWYCDGKSDKAKNEAEYFKAKSLAFAIIMNKAPKLVPGAIYYHANYVNPYWAKSMAMIQQVDNHLFY